MRQECYSGLHTSHHPCVNMGIFPNGKETPLKALKYCLDACKWKYFVYIWEYPGWEISLDLCKRGDTPHELSQLAAALWSLYKFFSKGICRGISQSALARRPSFLLQVCFLHRFNHLTSKSRKSIFLLLLFFYLKKRHTDIVLNGKF